jgi:MFS family permease
LLIGGTSGMLVSLLGISISFYLKKFEGFIILFFILTYCASFAASLGPISWVVISEIFPNKLRSKAMSIAVMSIWIANFLLILVFPFVLSKFGGATAFLIFAIMCMLLLMFAIFKIPETKGRSLEELEKILIKG